jgi:flavodoxin
LKGFIVYDSEYGNTQEIAEVMGEALESRAEVGVAHVSEVEEEQLVDVNFLIVGSPTQRFSPTPNMNEFLKAIPSQALQGVKVAAFDTRFTESEIGKTPVLAFFVRIFGYAAKPMADKLVKKGGELTLPPEGFYVGGMEGPLLDGEPERAAVWANEIVE